jgi:hypothetical protein
MVIVAVNRKAPGDRLSKLHPSNNRVVGGNAPSMGTIGLQKIKMTNHQSKGKVPSFKRYRGQCVSLTKPPRGKVSLAAFHH